MPTAVNYATAEDVARLAAEIADVKTKVADFAVKLDGQNANELGTAARVRELETYVGEAVKLIGQLRDRLEAPDQNLLDLSAYVGKLAEKLNDTAGRVDALEALDGAGEKHDTTVFGDVAGLDVNTLAERVIAAAGAKVAQRSAHPMNMKIDDLPNPMA